MSVRLSAIRSPQAACLISVRLDTMEKSYILSDLFYLNLVSFILRANLRTRRNKYDHIIFKSFGRL
jgi:hypothetical protein